MTEIKPQGAYRTKWRELDRDDSEYGDVGLHGSKTMVKGQQQLSPNSIHESWGISGDVQPFMERPVGSVACLRFLKANLPRVVLTLNGSGGDGSNKHVLSLLEGFVQSCPNVERKAAGMHERKRKGKSEKEWKRGQLRKYDPLDFSLFTASENAAGGIFQQTPGGENP